MTTAANQVVATADATAAIVNGFRVSSPTAPAAPAPAAAAPLSDAAASLPGTVPGAVPAAIPAAVPAAVPVEPAPQR